MRQGAVLARAVLHAVGNKGGLYIGCRSCWAKAWCAKTWNVATIAAELSWTMHCTGVCALAWPVHAPECNCMQTSVVDLRAHQRNRRRATIVQPCLGWC